MIRSNRISRGRVSLAPEPEAEVDHNCLELILDCRGDAESDDADPGATVPVQLGRPGPRVPLLRRWTVEYPTVVDVPRLFGLDAA